MTWGDVAITNAGLALLAESIAGKRLIISGASGGSGIVPPASLMMQTGLANEKQALSLVALINAEAGKKLKIQITSFGLEQGYTLNQVGVWAHLEGGEEKLFAILQDSKGVDIPSETDIPEFLMEFYALIEYSQSANISVTVDGTAYVSAETLQETIFEHDNDPNAHAGMREAVAAISRALPGVVITDIVIPAEGWEADTTMSSYPYATTVPVETAAAQMSPVVSLKPGSLETARAVGLCSSVEVQDRAIKLWAKKIPAADMIATVTLLSEGAAHGSGESSGGSDYVLTVDTCTRMGGMKIGSDVDISVDGTISANTGSMAATDEEVPEMLENTLK